MADQDNATYRLGDDGEFVIEQYNRAKPFASFFPGIAGRHGIPMWAFYVNRGQCVCSMGIQDKEQPIMEFLSANRAYQITSNQAFRTFAKITRGGATEYYEPFQQQVTNIGMDRVQRMVISSAELTIEEENRTLGLAFTVNYFNVPNDTYAGLVRVLTVRNIGAGDAQIEMLDGLPLIIPFGVDNYNLKHMRYLVESFVEVTNQGHKVPFFKGKVKQEDKPEVTRIRAGNFYAGFTADGRGSRLVPTVVDPKAVFGVLTDYAYPECFMAATPFHVPATQRHENYLPCALGLFRMTIKAGDEQACYSIIGHGASEQEVNSIVPRITRPAYVDAKRAENRQVISRISQCNFTCGRIREFDLYCRQNFLDNVLRGGLPISFEGKGTRTSLHLYSRKHGDLERDYNAYKLSPTNYSQGNGNYRDINQNRRSDLLVNPDVRESNVVHFYNLLQLDGFNPLGVGATCFSVSDRKALNALLKKAVGPAQTDDVRKLLAGHFMPGELFAALAAKKIRLKMDADAFVGELLAISTRHQETDYGHGYWSDHWHYNLDLLENYLAVYPENLRAILMEGRDFTFFDNPHRVHPRADKYVIWDGKPMQLDAVFMDKEKAAQIRQRKGSHHEVRTQFGEGEIYRTTLVNKMICLVANKLASLDVAGVGIEMESDKPNWYDALNGLPGLLGSSLSETLELKRLILFMLDAFDRLGLKDSEQWPLAAEIKAFVDGLQKLLKKHLADSGKDADFLFWDQASSLKEGYRETTRLGVSGREQSVRLGDLRAFLKAAIEKIDKGIAKAWDPKRYVLHTYFTTEVVDYKIITKKDGDGKQPKTNGRGLACFAPITMKHKPLPLFLEGPVHWLRIEKDVEKARKFAAGVKASALYDRKLKMYRVNEDLTDQPMEIGRCRTFSRGWLENESIWLHMEYKYMLELLRSGLHEEFYADFKNVFVPFMKPEVYGRSILENSSFIASSSNPDPAIHGNGFVARLSGSTAEFVHILALMTVGEKPFAVNGKGELELQFRPVLPSWLFTARARAEKIYAGEQEVERTFPANSFSFTFLGDILATYLNPRKRNTFGGGAVSPRSIKLIDDEHGRSIEVEGDTVSGPLAEMVRQKAFNRIEIELR